MSLNRNILGLLAIAGAAFAAGRFGAPGEHGSGAWAQAEPQLPGAMAAYLEAATPGEHHRHLDALVGTWEGKLKVRFEPQGEPSLARTTVSRRWILGGRFLQETVEVESDAGTFHGVGYIGYNNLDGRYEMIWIDSMSTAIHFETGTYETGRKVLRTRGSHRDAATGHLISTWANLDLSDPDRHTYEGYSVGPDGNTFKSFEGAVERRTPGHEGAVP